MTAIKLVISDLHLADGHAVLDGFGEYQQSALEGLLNVASTCGPLSQVEDVELIINGDCFDFLTVPPYDTAGTMNADLAVEKLAKIIAAHRPFFQTLRAFMAQPGRHVTFITGNHDIDLCFAEVRAGISDAIGTEQGAETVQFCPSRFYRPLPDVYIEHGNAYDFWNRDISELWDAQGQPLIQNPRSITLPAGSHYLQHAALPINLAYPYIDHFEPSMSILCQMALLSLLNPQIVIGTVQQQWNFSRSLVRDWHNSPQVMSMFLPGCLSRQCWTSQSFTRTLSHAIPGGLHLLASMQNVPRPTS